MTRHLQEGIEKGIQTTPRSRTGGPEDGSAADIATSWALGLECFAASWPRLSLDLRKTGLAKAELCKGKIPTGGGACCSSARTHLPLPRENRLRLFSFRSPGARAGSRSNEEIACGMVAAAITERSYGWVCGACAAAGKAKMIQPPIPGAVKTATLSLDQPKPGRFL